jgi:hypothetical protein
VDNHGNASQVARIPAAGVVAATIQTGRREPTRKPLLSAVACASGVPAATDPIAVVRNEGLELELSFARWGGRAGDGNPAAAALASLRPIAGQWILAGTPRNESISKAGVRLLLEHAVPMTGSGIARSLAGAEVPARSRTAYTGPGPDGQPAETHTDWHRPLGRKVHAAPGGAFTGRREWRAGPG